MKIPRNLTGFELVRMLGRFGYEEVHQSGSHIVIKTIRNGENTQSVPNHKPLKVGTLDGILKEISDHLGITKRELVRLLTSKKANKEFS